MAGHSKWANIKHRKGRQDEKKQKIFSKLIRELTVASKLGGSEVSDNPRLRLALDLSLIHAFSKCGGSLGTDGSVSYLFSKKGQIVTNESNQDKLLELLISEGIEDIESSEDNLTLIFTDANNIHNVKTVLENENIEILQADMIMDSSQTVKLDSEATEKVIRLIESLEDLDDVQNVFSNAEFSLDDNN